MRRFSVALLIPLIGLLTISVFAGEIGDFFRAQSGPIAPAAYDWRSDPGLQNHGITEIAFERPKSLDRTIWESYTVKFFPDGHAEYTGHDHVRSLGLHIGRIPTQEFQRLALLIDQLGFDNLQTNYYRTTVGAATNYTSVVRNGQRRTIQNYADAGPVQLWAIELAIQDLVKKITWES
jgi:hypothetical protein